MEDLDETWRMSSIDVQQWHAREAKELKAFHKDSTFPVVITVDVPSRVLSDNAGPDSAFDLSRSPFIFPCPWGVYNYKLASSSSNFCNIFLAVFAR
jgi:hypothetical protein